MHFADFQFAAVLAFGVSVIGLITWLLAELAFRFCYWLEKRQRIAQARCPKPLVKHYIPSAYAWEIEGNRNR
jgi:hypothetical protein